MGRDFQVVPEFWNDLFARQEDPNFENFLSGLFLFHSISYSSFSRFFVQWTAPKIAPRESAKCSLKNSQVLIYTQFHEKSLDYLLIINMINGRQKIKKVNF